MRPITFALWLGVFGIQLQGAATGSGGIGWLTLAMTTVLFAGVHAQFWLDESEQGRRVHDGFERMRGQIYEDDETGLPNSRHFVFQLRRQMMRSVRNGRGFSIVLATISPHDESSSPKSETLRKAATSMKAGLGDCDFVARLQGASFGAVVLDEAEATATDKSRDVRDSLTQVLNESAREGLAVAVSMTGYEGELEVRDVLRRAQRDLQSSQEVAEHPGTPARPPGAA